MKPNEKDYHEMKREVALAVKEALDPFIEKGYPISPLLNGIVTCFAVIVASTPELNKSHLMNAINIEIDQALSMFENEMDNN